MIKKVLHIDTNHPYLATGIEALGFVNEFDTTSDKEHITAIIHQYEGLVVRSRISIDKNLLRQAANLKFIARVGAGLENIDTEAAASQNIQVLSAAEGNANAVGEHTLGMLLSLLNNINISHNEIHRGLWLREENRGEELEGKTIGIVGYGNMGKSFAQKLKGFDVEVLCYDILPNKGDDNARQVDLQTLHLSVDILSLHVPHTPDTVNMINAEEILKFAKPFYILNTARGTCIHTSDLVLALQQGKIKGAGLDVLEYEKTSFENLFETQTNPDLEYLLNANNVILTPHIAGWSHQSAYKMAKILVEKIIARV